MISKIKEFLVKIGLLKSNVKHQSTQTCFEENEKTIETVVISKENETEKPDITSHACA